MREATRAFGLHRETVSKMPRLSVPPGYRRCHRPRRPKLDPFEGIIDRRSGPGFVESYGLGRAGDSWFLSKLMGDR